MFKLSLFCCPKNEIYAEQNKSHRTEPQKTSTNYWFCLIIGRASNGAIKRINSPSSTLTLVLFTRARRRVEESSCQIQLGRYCLFSLGSIFFSFYFSSNFLSFCKSDFSFTFKLRFCEQFFIMKQDRKWRQ